MVFVFVAASIMSGMFIASIVDLPSALMLVVPLLFFLILSKSGSVIGRYIRTSFKKEHTYTRAELEGLSAAVKNTIKFILGTGGVGFLFGIIAIFMYLENRERLGTNLAISLITVLYSIAVSYFVFFPTQAWAENKLNALLRD